MSLRPIKVIVSRGHGEQQLDCSCSPARGRGRGRGRSMSTGTGRRTSTGTGMGGSLVQFGYNASVGAARTRHAALRRASVALGRDVVLSRLQFVATVNRGRAAGALFESDFRWAQAAL